MNSAVPKISIIVPVYNAQQFLKACIDTVLAQTYNDYELILIDDGSSDRSAEMCDAYAQQDERIKVVHQPNAGVSGARNRGLSVARGEYVTFVDADDWLDDSLLAHMIEPALQFHCDLVVSGLAWHFPDGRAEYQKFEAMRVADNPLDVGEIVLEIEAKGLIHGPYQKLIRRSLLEQAGIRFPPLSFGEDTLFNLAYLSRIDSICVVPHVDYHYRRNDASISTAPQRRYGDVMKLLNGRRQGFDALAKRFEVPLEAVTRTIAFNCMLCHMTALYAAYSPRYLLPLRERLAALQHFKGSDDYEYFRSNYQADGLKNRIFKAVVVGFPPFMADVALRGMLRMKYRNAGAN